ncbi:extracellular solute-binding protein [Actinomadura verrucosospora]|uniref:Carbohydrate ABC transporter substrate-binding protein n=1 Tax=Actinomadura verrucosospora TaxID=46165 RepID=A0A7D3W444_ACTVE|nr:extracellular solute-binding protein [Actinomadura verrucosospora]QKG25671.1 carbohydrate ABC transporter substrate-binding protein [Actinomadura verrucosospora]
MGARRRRVVASVVAFAVTLVLLQGIRWSLSYHPLFHGCGEHRGLTIAADVDVSPDFQRRALVEDWNHDHPHDRATLIEVARSTDTTRSQLASALESGSCAYDVLLVDVAWLPEYAHRGFLAPVKGKWMERPSDFLRSTLDTGKWKGTQYAVPWFTDAGLLYVRKGTKAPGSFDDLVKAGYATQLADYEGLTANALEAIWNSTGELVLSDVVHKVDERTAQVVLDGLDHLVHGGTALTASRDFMEDGSFKAFTSGEPLMRNWPYAFRALTADPRVRNGFDVRPLPGRGYSVLGGWDLAVSARSKRQAEAGELIKALTGTKAQGKLFACGGFTPTRKSTLNDTGKCDDPKYQDDELPSPERFKEFADTLRTALFQAQPRPITPYYAQFSETFRGCVEDVLDAGHHVPGARRPDAATLAKVLTAALKGKHSSC